MGKQNPETVQFPPNHRFTPPTRGIFRETQIEWTKNGGRRVVSDRLVERDMPARRTDSDTPWQIAALVFVAYLLGQCVRSYGRLKGWW